MANPTQTKEFGAKIPQDLYDEFRELFPMYGATTWFIQTSLESFLAQVRENSSLQHLVEKSIDTMLLERRLAGEETE